MSLIKVISYNVNGIRSAISKGFFQWLESESPDILAIQETKAQPEQIDSKKFEQLGYHCYIHSALKKGYSGVALFSKIMPEKVTIGTGIKKYDDEGRLIRADFPQFTHICTYFPSGTTGDVRQAVKMEWLSDFSDYIIHLKKTNPKILISGDLNIAHQPIDINHPERHTGVSGFLPEEREWFDRFLESGFIDCFRKFNQKPEQYSWWSFRAGSRHKNLGWRIDYHLASLAMDHQVTGAAILPQVVHSDHCPVIMSLNI